MPPKIASTGIVVGAACLLLAAALGMFWGEMSSFSFGLLQLGIAALLIKLSLPILSVASGIYAAAGCLLAAHGIASCFQMVPASGDRFVLLLLFAVLLTNIGSRRISYEATTLSKSQG